MRKGVAATIEKVNKSSNMSSTKQERVTPRAQELNCVDSQYLDTDQMIETITTTQSEESGCQCRFCSNRLKQYSRDDDEEKIHHSQTVNQDDETPNTLTDNHRDRSHICHSSIMGQRRCGPKKSCPNHEKDRAMANLVTIQNNIKGEASRTSVRRLALRS